MSSDTTTKSKVISNLNQSIICSINLENTSPTQMGCNSASILTSAGTDQRPYLHPNRLQGCTHVRTRPKPTGSLLALKVHTRGVLTYITVQCVGIRLQTKAGATAVKHPSPSLAEGGFHASRGDTRQLTHRHRTLVLSCM